MTLPIGRSGLALVLVTIFASAQEADPQPPKTAQTDSERLATGVCKHRTHENILGACSERLVRIARDGERWTIEFLSVRIPGVNERGRRTRTYTGPTELRVAPPVVAWQEGGVEKESTFRLDGERLVLPSFVQTDDRTWEFLSTSTRGVFRCAADPLRVPAGEAQFPSVAAEGRSMRFAMEEVADPRHPGGLAKILRFFVRLPDGTDHDECRLIWDSLGAPRFEGSSLYHGFEEVSYAPIEDAEWQAALALPDLGGGK